jgi:hypothetical protein
MPQHQVSQGECLSSIADHYGFFWQTLWDHAENEQLKQDRKDPNVLREGDSVFVPDKALGEESCATEQRHRFRKKGVPAMLRIRVLVDGEAQSSADYILIIDGRSVSGTTDGDGLLEQSIPPGAVDGELRVTKDNQERRFYLSLGHLDPIDTELGVKQRLRQLAYQPDADLAAALQRFQRDQGLTVSGEIDSATRDKLKEAYGQ